MAHGSLDLDDLKIDDSGELRITGLHLQRGHGVGSGPRRSGSVARTGRAADALA